MSHHTTDGPFDGNGEPEKPRINKMARTPDELERIRRLMSDTVLSSVRREMPGPTHDFPAGKLGPHDEGGIQMTFSTMRASDGTDRLVIDFGHPVHSLGLRKVDAVAIAAKLSEWAARLD